MKKQKANCMNCNSLQPVKEIEYLGDEKWVCPNCKKIKKKLICKGCEEWIDSLDYDVTATCSSSINQDNVLDKSWGKNARESFDSDSLMASVQFDNFRCPNCSRLVGNGTEEDAIKFLKGELKCK